MTRDVHGVEPHRGGTGFDKRSTWSPPQPMRPLTARKRRGTKLQAQLQRTKSTGVPLGGILRKLSEMQCLQFRRDPRHDARVPDTSRNAAEEERASVLQLCSDLRRDTSAGVGGGSEATPSPSTLRAGGGSGALGVDVLHVVVRGSGGYFASPSSVSSVSRGRARRARELKKVVLMEERGAAAAAAAAATGTRTPGRQKWQKAEASDAFLLGRVSVLSAREFDTPRGYCGRDPDLYVQHYKFNCHGPGIPQLADEKVGRQRLLAVRRAQFRSGGIRY